MKNKIIKLLENKSRDGFSETTESIPDHEFETIATEIEYYTQQRLNKVLDRLKKSLWEKNNIKIEYFKLIVIEIEKLKNK